MKATAEVAAPGLGLFIVSETAKAHGGKALVTSTAEHGTKFAAVIPRDEP